MAFDSKRTLSLKLFGSERMESREDREHMSLVCRLSSNERIRRLGINSENPGMAQHSFAKLAEDLGLGAEEIAREYQAVIRSEGIIRSVRYLPDMMEQAAQDAMSRDEKCHTCDATGQVTVDIRDEKGKKTGTRQEKCANCDGSGKVYVLGNLDRLKLMFETHGLTGRGAGPLVNVDLRKIDNHETLEGLSASVSSIIEGSTVPRADNEQ